MKKIEIALLAILLAIPTFALNDSDWVDVYAPAVAQTSEGMVGALSTIRVRVEPGNGHVFVDTFPLTEIDMQSSARMAASVASSISNKSINDYDFFVVVRSDAQVIGGTSAGGAMTVAITSALNSIPLRRDVMMTGTISPDGSIGPVSGIPQKMEAAREAGAKVFLIPKGQANYTYTITETRQVGPLSIISQRPEEMNLIQYGKELGLTVKEVSNIREAVKEFTGVELRQPATDTINRSEYTQLMKTHAEELEKEARDRYASAQRVNNSATRDYLDESRSRFEEGIRLISQKRYYVAASSFFESLVYSSYVINYDRYHNNPDEGIKQVGDWIERIDLKIKEKRENYDKVYLQCYGAAEEKIMEALDNFEDAYNFLQNGNIADGIFALSYAMERASSAEWWFDIASERNGELSKDYVSSLALSAMNAAQEVLIYAQFSTPPELATLLLQANDELNIAREAMNESYIAGAVVLASKALALSELVIELGARGMDDESLNVTKENAINAVARTQSSGVNPILALAYLESAESYEGKDIPSALIYYKYAECISRMSGTP